MHLERQAQFKQKNKRLGTESIIDGLHGIKEGDEDIVQPYSGSNGICFDVSMGDVH